MCKSGFHDDRSFVVKSETSIVHTQGGLLDVLKLACTCSLGPQFWGSDCANIRSAL